MRYTTGQTCRLAVGAITCVQSRMLSPSDGAHLQRLQGAIALSSIHHLPHIFSHKDRFHLASIVFDVSVLE